MVRLWSLIALLLLCLPGCPTGRSTDDDDSVAFSAEDLDGDGYCPDPESCQDSGLEPGDCDDTESTVFPAAPELCDGLDNDCNGQVDEDFDADRDGYPDQFGDGCSAHFPLDQLDCADLIATINPGADEQCDGNDTDCNGLIDDGLDEDLDGFQICGGNADCDDTNAAVYPDAEELCDGLDDNCDGQIDNGVGPEFQDNDGDGYTLCAGDCDDFSSGVNPGATEGCDEIDDDCDGQIDEDLDQDDDGVMGPYPNCFQTFGVVDCDDHNPDLYPGAAEICDGIDNNCDGFADENLDFDNDGFTSCTEPLGDCDSLDASVHPGATETCDGIDNNCDGQIDESFDNDGDGQSPCAGDCNDTDPTIYQGAPELCDSQDNNCDLVMGPDEIDQDGDGTSACDGDCDESDPLIYPGAVEVCDTLDDDCDGVVPADERDEDLDGYIACTPAGCAISLVTDSDQADFWQGWTALDALGLDLNRSFTDAVTQGWMEDTSAFDNSQVLVWYTGGRDIRQAELDGLEAWVQAGGGLVVTGPEADGVAGTGDDDDSALGDDDDSAVVDDDDSAVVDDDDSAVVDDDDSAVVDDDDSAVVDDDDSAGPVLFADTQGPIASRMAALIRSLTSGTGPQTDLCAISDTSTPMTNGPYGVFNSGLAFTASSTDHDNVVADGARGAVRVASVGNRAKILWTETLGGGVVMYWNGNDALGDWDVTGDPNRVALLRNAVHAMNLSCGGTLEGGDCDDADATLFPGTCP